MASIDTRLFKSLALIFNASQESSAGHEKLIVKCQQLYRESEFKVFFETFTSIMQSAMVSMQKNPNLDRCIDFVSKFASIASTKPPMAKENGIESKEAHEQSSTLNETTLLDEETENPFLTSLMDWLIDNLKANTDAVRYRCCNILSKLMAAINNEQFIDEDLYDRLCDGLLERLKDVNSRVQVQAITAIYRLQDPNDKDCRVIKALLFLMSYDPNWQVRYQAISNIAFSKVTLSDIIDRVRDPSPFVRRKAIFILSEKVLIKFISIEKRLFILNYSLKDEDAGVLDTCCKKLLPSWLAHKENDLCKLLKALDVVDATETAELMLNSMYKESSIETITNEFVELLNENHLIPAEKLDVESVFYWSWVCSKCKNIPNENQNRKGTHGNRIEDADDTENDRTVPQNNDKTTQIEGEDNLDRLLPSLTEFCDYVSKLFKAYDNERIQKPNDEKFQIETTFIIKQLFKMFQYIDFSDKHGKKTLINFCEQLFSNKNYVFLFESIMKIYKMLIPNLQQRINKLVELISDLKEHTEKEETEPDDVRRNNTLGFLITETNEYTSSNSNNVDQVSKSALSTVNSGPPPKTKLEISLQISELKFRRYKLKDDFEKMCQDMKCVDKQVDMTKLGELREEIKKCEDEITQLQIQLNNPQPLEQAQVGGGAETFETPLAGGSQNSTPQVVCDEQMEVTEKQPEEPINPIEIENHCLQLAICLMEDLEIKNLSPQLRSLCDTLILPNIGSISEEIRYLAVKALCLTCMLKLELAQKYTPLLLEMIQQDKKEVVLMAFRGMINLIMAFSINRLICNEGQIEDIQMVTEAQKNVLTVMWSLIDSEDSDVYTTATEGFCKLYMTGHLLSAKMFSKLFIMYYSPLNENDTKLKAILSAFLPQFSFLRFNNQLCVEESFMITVKSLINAPVDNYLCEIDLNKVIETLLHLTNPKNLISRKTVNKRQGHTINICHENITKSICLEILKDENTYKCKTYLKIIQMTDLSEADYLSLKEIHQLANEVHEHIQDKSLKKTAKKFVETVHALLEKLPEYLEEQKIQDEIGKVDNENTTIATNVNSSTIATTSQQQNPTQEYNSDQNLISNSESNQEDPDLVDHTFRKLKKKNLLRINSKPTKSQTKWNARDTTETETETENESEKLGGLKAKNQKAASQSLLTANSQMNMSKVKIKINETTSDESDSGDFQFKKRGSTNQNMSKRSKRLSKKLDSSKATETLTINDTTENDSSSEDKEPEQPSRILRRSLVKEQVIAQDSTVSKPASSKTSIKITKLNPNKDLKLCHVALTRLDESRLSQKGDTSLTEDEEKRKNTRMSRNSPQLRNSRDSNKNNLVVDLKGKDASRRCVSLSNNSAIDHGSDNEPPKKVARRTPSSQSDIQNKRSASSISKKSAVLAPLRQSPRRSPR